MSEILSVHKIGYRLLKMIHGVDSTILPLHLLEVCLSVVQVYAGLYHRRGSAAAPRPPPSEARRWDRPPAPPDRSSS